MIRFDNSNVTFQKDLLIVGPIKPLGTLQPSGYSVPILYDNRKLQLRFPKSKLNGIYHNKSFDNYSLLYPNTQDTPEQVQFHKFLQDLQQEASAQLSDLIVRESKSNKTLKKMTLNLPINIFSDQGFFLKFPHKNNALRCTKCFNFKGQSQDILKHCKYGMVGNYVLLVNIPGFYLNTSYKQNQVYLQMFPDTIIANTKLQQIEPINPKDILGNDLESSSSSESDSESE